VKPTGRAAAQGCGTRLAESYGSGITKEKPARRLGACRSWYDRRVPEAPSCCGARKTNFEAPTSPRYSKEEFARRGDEIYEREVLPRLTSEDEGKYALIDIETGDYEIDWDELAASNRLFARRPDAQV
jgi:hypothetical protein